MTNHRPPHIIGRYIFQTSSAINMNNYSMKECKCMLHLTAWAISKFERGACKRGIMTASADTDCQTSNRVVRLKRLQGISRALCCNWDLVSKLANSIAPAATRVASEGRCRPQGSTYVRTHERRVRVCSHAFKWWNHACVISMCTCVDCTYGV